MGRGNWIPDTPIYQGDYDLVYVEIGDVCESSPDEDEIEWLYADFKDNLRLSCPSPSARSSGAKGASTLAGIRSSCLPMIAHGGHGLPGGLLAPGDCDCGP